jgi:hypothetical protein
MVSLQVPDGNAFVPAGQSVWEFGVIKEKFVQPENIEIPF